MHILILCFVWKKLTNIIKVNHEDKYPDAQYIFEHVKHWLSTIHCIVADKSNVCHVTKWDLISE